MDETEGDIDLLYFAFLHHDSNPYFNNFASCTGTGRLAMGRHESPQILDSLVTDVHNENPLMILGFNRSDEVDENSLLLY